MAEENHRARITMVKKRLENGEPCRKCDQTEEMLRRRGLWETIDEVVWADESDSSSPGMQLAKEHGIETAPFFLVSENGKITVYASALKVAKEVLSRQNSTSTGAAEKAQCKAATDGVEQRIQFDAEQVERLQLELKGQSPQAILEFALRSLGSRCAIAFSGAEDVALIDMASKLGLEFSVFCLDTGRLHPETYRFIDTVRQSYGIEIELISPDFVGLESLVRKKGLFSFYEEGHGECCGVRKIEPLRRVLSKFDGWITGQRRDQSPTRAEVPEMSWDTSHDSAGMLKLNPLAAQSQAQVWQYIRDNDVPYNELHDRGFISIGCEPCTRATRPGEHERAGRWWWEDQTKRECGLHLASTDE